MSKFVILLVVLLLCCVNNIDAWWCTGHMIVAAIAEDLIKNTSPSTWAFVDRAIVYHSRYTPLSPDFVTSACWADDLKAKSRLEASWHFINYPIIGDVPPVNPTKSNTKYDPNIVWALDTITTTLSKSRDEIATIEEGRLVAFLIHLIGDIVQPLHTSTMFSATHEGPNGDFGGNNYKIRYKSDNHSSFYDSNLHAFWDSNAGAFINNPKRPLNLSDREMIFKNARQITERFPVSQFSKQLNLSYTDLARDSWKISRDLAYSTPENYDYTVEYVRLAQEASFKRLALGGYKLAKVLLDLYGPPNATARFIHNEMGDNINQLETELDFVSSKNLL